jgi:hypothetical protein
MLCPMDSNIPASTPPCTPPGKRRKVDAPTPTRLPSFEEQPHSSPSKIGELGLHVLLSPKNQEPRSEQIVVGRALTFGEPVKTETHQVVSAGRPRESMYVTAFNTAVDTVLEREGHLFSPEEMAVIDLYRKLPCISSRLLI